MPVQVTAGFFARGKSMLALSAMEVVFAPEEKITPGREESQTAGDVLKALLKE